MVYRNVKTGIEFSTNCVIKSEDCIEVKSVQSSDTTENAKPEKKIPTSKGKKK